MNFFFDYIYYRITQWKFRTQGDLSVTAVGFISLMQSFLILLIIYPILLYFLPNDNPALKTKQLCLIAGAIYIVLLFVNYKSYSGKYDKYKLYWKDERSTKRFFKGILVILSLLLPIIIFVLINNYTHK
jgi:hypothetical protein